MKDDISSYTGLKKIIYVVRRYFWVWFIAIITLSIVLMFAGSLVFDKKIELSIINSWVGVILGLVALVATVFSLGLSFYNFDKQNELNKQSEELLNKILTVTTETKDTLVNYTSENSLIKTKTQKNSNVKKKEIELDSMSKALEQLSKILNG